MCKDENATDEGLDYFDEECGCRVLTPKGIAVQERERTLKRFVLSPEITELRLDPAFGRSIQAGLLEDESISYAINKEVTRLLDEFGYPDNCERFPRVINAIDVLIPVRLYPSEHQHLSDYY